MPSAVAAAAPDLLGVSLTTLAQEQPKATPGGPKKGDGKKKGGGKGGDNKGLIKPQMSDTVHVDVYADNWFAMFINGELVAVDSIKFTPHNVISFDILPEYPMTIAVIAIIAFLTLGVRRRALVPGRWQSLAELSYEFVGNMIRDNVGKEGLKYFPLIFTLFMFVLFGNLLGLVPYSFTYTSHIAVTAALALMVIVVVTGVGLALHGFHFFSFFSFFSHFIDFIGIFS